MYVHEWFKTSIVKKEGNGPVGDARFLMPCVVVAVNEGVLNDIQENPNPVVVGGMVG